MSKISENYWDTYYRQKKKPSPPSQFAAYVLNEFSHKRRFVDIGCGDGRDSLFFARHGMQVLGLDGSSSAIKICQDKVLSSSLTDVSFQQLRINHPEEISAFLDFNRKIWSGAVIYARFFLHAIDEISEQNFLKLASELIGNNGHLCLEFRTLRDEFQQKETGNHYRRYIEPLKFLSHARRHGLDCTYLVEGFGFAKYKSDDAHVARMILKKL